MSFSLRISSDNIGMMSSALCIVHCIATPFLFVWKATCNLSCHSAPLWWRSFDFIFLTIALFAVIYSVKQSTNNWVKGLLISSWVLLLFSEMGKHYLAMDFIHHFSYFPAVALILIHLYNKKYCCTSKCC